MEKLSKLSYDDLDKVLKALNKELRSGNIEKEYITKKSVSLDTPNYCCGDTIHDFKEKSHKIRD